MKLSLDKCRPTSKTSMSFNISFPDLLHVAHKHVALGLAIGAVICILAYSGAPDLASVAFAMLSVAVGWSRFSPKRGEQISLLVVHVLLSLVFAAVYAMLALVVVIAYLQLPVDVLPHVFLSLSMLSERAGAEMYAYAFGIFVVLWSLLTVVATYVQSRDALRDAGGTAKGMKVLVRRMRVVLRSMVRVGVRRIRNSVAI
jgi:hypothetical protein